jgi:hypothetical protein
LAEPDQLTFLNQMTAIFGAPETPMDATKGVCEISVNGAHLGVRVVASSKADAKSIAGAIDTWRSSAGLPGDVEYSQQTDSANADYVFNTAAFGRTHSEMSVNVPTLVSSIKKVLPGCNFALAVPDSSTLTGMLPATKFSDDGAIAYWNVTDGGSPVTALLTLPVWAVLYLVGCVLLPTCCVLGTCAIILRRWGLRQSRSQAICVWTLAVTALIAIIAPIFVLPISPRILEPILWLWDGSNSYRLGYAVCLSAMVAGVVAGVFFLYRIEYKSESGEVEAAKARLTQRVASVAERMGMTAPQVKLNSKLIYSRIIYTRGGCICASCDLVKTASDSELDVKVAHELATLKLGFGRWRNWPLTGGLAEFVLLFAATTVPSSPLHVNLIIFYCWLVQSIVTVIWLNYICSKRMPNERVKADELAAHALRV